MKTFAKLLFSVIFIFTAAGSQAQTKLIINAGTGLPLISAYKTFIKLAYREIGIEVQFRDLPTKRSLLESSRGKSDGEIIRRGGINKQFPSLAPVPVKLNTFDISAYSINRDLKLAGGGPEKIRESLLSLKLKPGIFRGMQLTDVITKGLERQEVDTLKALFGALKLGRNDVALMVRVMGNAFLNANPEEYEMIHEIKPPLMQIPLFHYLHEKNAKLIPRITPILQKMVDDKTLEKLIKESQ